MFYILRATSYMDFFIKKNFLTGERTLMYIVD